MRACLSVLVVAFALGGCGLEQAVKNRLSSQKGDDGDSSTKPGPQVTATVPASGDATVVTATTAGAVPGGAVVTLPGAAGPMTTGQPGQAAPVKQDPADVKDAAGLVQFLGNVAKGASEPVPLAYRLVAYAGHQQQNFDGLGVEERALGGTLSSLDQLNSLGDAATSLTPLVSFSTGLAKGDVPYGPGWLYGGLLGELSSGFYDEDKYWGATADQPTYSYQTGPLDLTKLATKDELFTEAQRVTSGKKDDKERSVADFGFTFALRDPGYAAYAKGIAGTLADIAGIVKLDLPAGYDDQSCDGLSADKVGQIAVTLEVWLGARHFVFLSQQVGQCGFVYAQPDDIAKIKSKLEDKVKGLKSVSASQQQGG